MQKTKNGHRRCRICSRFGCNCRSAMAKADNRRAKQIIKKKS